MMKQLNHHVHFLFYNTRRITKRNGFLWTPFFKVNFIYYRKFTDLNKNKCEFKVHSDRKIITCQNCKIKIEAEVVPYFCKNCKALTSLDVFKSFNIFELFHIDVKYEINKNDLKKRFSDIQKIYHPDKNVQNIETCSDQINETSSYLNDSYNLLMNDISRATYLVQLIYNYRIPEEESLDDEEFLNEIMQINEEIDNSKNPKVLSEKYTKKYETYVKDITFYFKEKQLDNILKNLKKLKFIDKILERIKNL